MSWWDTIDRVLGIDEEEVDEQADGKIIDGERNNKSKTVIDSEGVPPSITEQQSDANKSEEADSSLNTDGNAGERASATASDESVEDTAQLDIAADITSSIWSLTSMVGNAVVDVASAVKSDLSEFKEALLQDGVEIVEEREFQREQERLAKTKQREELVKEGKAAPSAALDRLDESPDAILAIANITKNIFGMTLSDSIEGGETEGDEKPSETNASTIMGLLDTDDSANEEKPVTQPLDLSLEAVVEQELGKEDLSWDDGIDEPTASAPDATTGLLQVNVKAEPLVATKDNVDEGKASPHSESHLKDPQSSPTLVSATDDEIHSGLEDLSAAIVPEEEDWDKWE